MIPIIIFILSISLQLTTALYALYLIRLTHKKTAWILIASAMLLMAARRTVLFFSILPAGRLLNVYISEIIAFAITCLMLMGVHLLKRYFMSINADSLRLKQTEDAFFSSEARYRAYIDMTGQIGWGWVTNAQGEVVEDIPTLRRFNGQTYEEAKGFGWAKTLHPDDIELTIQVWNKAVDTKSPYETEYRMKRYDGVYRNILARGFPVFKKDGSIKEWVGTCIDITRRKQAEQELSLVKQRLELAIKSSKLGIWDWDIPNNIMTWDDQMLVLYGLTRETFPGGVEAWMNGLHPEDREKILGENEAALRGEKEWDTEFRVLHPNGTVLYIKANGKVIWDSKGVPIRMLGINYDITERKHIEEQLLKSREELEIKVAERTKELSLTIEQLNAFAKEKEALHDELNQIFTLSADMICIADINGYFRKVNPAWEKTLGYTEEELLSKPFMYFIHPEDKEKTLEIINERLKAGATVLNFENRYICNNGAIKWLSWTSNPILEQGITYAITRDITERKHIEIALQQSEEKFRTLFESSIDAIYIIDLKGNFVDINKAAYERLGYTKEEMMSMPISQLDPPEFAAKLPQRMKYLQNHGEGVFESVNLKKDGTAMQVEINSRFMEFQGQKVFFSIIRDITERKQADAALRQSEEKFHSLFESSLDALYIVDLKGNLIDANKTAYERLGYTKEELLSLNLSQIDHSDYTYKIPELMEHMKKFGSAVFELVHLKKDGTTMPVEVNARYMDFQGQKVFFSIIRDITERKRSEEKLRKREWQLQESQRVSHLGSWDYNLITETLEWSDETYRLFDQSPKNFIPSVSKFASFIHPDDFPVFETTWTKALESDNNPYYVNIRIINDSGKQWVMEAYGIVRRNSSYKPLSILGTAQDITERKKAEEKITQSLNEKDTLLKELYHRTKNNMQVIISLLNLQSRDINDKKLIQLVEDTKNRIYSMALVHEKLYKAKNLSQIFLSDYIKDLANALMKSHYTDNKQISLKIDINDIPLSIETITPLGLVINELMTNVLKYAFPDNRKGDILIKARQNTDKTIELTFNDNGIGIPKNINIKETESLGLTIVHMLVTSQLKGILEIKVENGTTFIIKFKDIGIPLDIDEDKK
ncbi:MAG: PAS domain S-box protein [Nitrospirae bacterium]|nr:PAS domain S-box protein [Nitrospirota bacterium]